MKNNYFSHSSSIISDDSFIGAGSRIWHFTHIFGKSRIGKNCILGQNVMAGPNIVVGNNCKIQNNVSLYKGVILEDDVFCGPSCVFTNVKNPRAFIDRRSEFSTTLVKKGATLGANSTIICGVTVGSYSMIGAGSVVTKNILSFSLVVGTPAKRIGWISKSGERLGRDLICPRTGDQYEEKNGKLFEKL